MRVAIFSYERDVWNHSPDTQVEYFDADTSNLLEKVQVFKPDLIIEREFNDGRALFQVIYKELPGVPKAYWCIDAHITLAQHINYAKDFDFVFLAQSWFVPLFQQEVKGQCFYLPLCFPQPRSWFDSNPNNEERDIDLSFVGWIRPSLHVDRKRFVEHLLNYLGDRFLATRELNYDKMIEILRSSKTTFNCSLNNDLNFRVWEAIGTGTVLITDEVSDMGMITSLASRLMLFDKRSMMPDFEARIDLGLTISELKKPIIHREDNIEWIKENHTLTNRFAEMFTMMGTGVQRVY